MPEIFSNLRTVDQWNLDIHLLWTVDDNKIMTDKHNSYANVKIAINCNRSLAQESGTGPLILNTK